MKKLYGSEVLFSSFGARLVAAGDVSILDIPKAEVVALMQKNGALLFRGFGVSDQDFTEFSNRFLKKVVSHGSTSRNWVSADGTTVEVVKGTQGMSLHRELGYLPWSPDFIWFFCRKAAQKDGETTVCDARAFANALSPSTAALFKSKQIVYRHTWPLKVWQGYLQTESADEAVRYLKSFSEIRNVEHSRDGGMNFHYYAHAMRDANGQTGFLNSILNMLDSKALGFCQIFFADGEPLSQAVIDELRSLDLGLAERVQWQNGDLLMLDNNRVMHGRRAFTGERVIHTRFGVAA